MARARRGLRTGLAAAALLAAADLAASTLLAETFDALDGWRTAVVGAGDLGLAEGGPGGRYLRLEGAGGLVVCSRDLPAERVRGQRLTVRCLTRLSGVAPGPRPAAAPKLHVAVVTPAGIRHAAARLQQDTDWRQTALVVEIPDTALRVVLNVAVEATRARLEVDNLFVIDERPETRCLDLAGVANTRLAGLPTGALEVNGIPFRFAGAADGTVPNALLLRGLGREDGPVAPAAPVPVNAVVRRVHILHAAWHGAASRETPCAIWVARFWDGQEATLSVFEGRETGGSAAGVDSPDWRVVWRGRDADGSPLQLGLTTWTLFLSEVPLESLTLRSFAGAPPLVAAITVEATPARRPTSSDTEGEDEQGE